MTTFQELLDGKVIEATKEQIIILKDGKKFQIAFGSGIVKELIKH